MVSKFHDICTVIESISLLDPHSIPPKIVHSRQFQRLTRKFAFFLYPVGFCPRFLSFIWTSTNAFQLALSNLQRMNDRRLVNVKIVRSWYFLCSKSLRGKYFRWILISTISREESLFPSKNKYVLKILESLLNLFII